MRGPCGRGKLSSGGRVSILPAGVLEEHSLAWGVRGQGEPKFAGREATRAKEQRGCRSLPGEPANAGVAGLPGPVPHSPLEPHRAMPPASCPCPGALSPPLSQVRKPRPRSQLQVAHLQEVAGAGTGPWQVTQV